MCFQDAVYVYEAARLTSRMALLSSAVGKHIDCMAIRACATCASDVTSPWPCIATGEISLDAKDWKRKFRFFLGRRGAEDPATHPSEKNE